MPGLAGRGVLAKPTTGAPAWNTYVASLSPWAWWKLDEDTLANEGDKVVEDASGNGRVGVFNGDSGDPTRHTTAIVTGSSFAVTTGSTGANVRDTASSFIGNLMAGSFTFGCFLKGTGSTTVRRFVQRVTGGSGVGVLLNYPSSGDVRFYFDTNGSDADSLLASAAGWNNGASRLLMFEYDSVADTISIWLSGTRIATRARAGIKPTAPTGQHDWLFHPNAPLSGIQADEYLFFTRVLTSGEHSALAAYAA